MAVTFSLRQIMKDEENIHIVFINLEKATIGYLEI